MQEVRCPVHDVVFVTNGPFPTQDGHEDCPHCREEMKSHKPSRPHITPSGPGGPVIPPGAPEVERSDEDKEGLRKHRESMAG